MVEISTKEARVLFAKFLMEKNCLTQYLACFKHAHAEYSKSSPREIMVATIDRAIKYYGDNANLGQILNKIPISFSWFEVDNFMKSNFNEEDYWMEISNSLDERYKDVKIKK